MTTRRRGGVLGAVLLVLAATLAVSGCSTIPTDGAVHSTEVSGGAPQDQFIRVLARGPSAGASPVEIVRGFLAASASFDDGHAVARSFLTDKASDGWDPTLHVAIYDADEGYEISSMGGDTYRMLAMRKAGGMTARGEFLQPNGSTISRADFSLDRVGDEWRISGVPQGLILSTTDVARAYRTLNLYFLDVAGGVLVPAPVALPAQNPGVATRLVREVLRGPTEWLAPSVQTGFPRGTELSVDSVPIEDGIARVDLDAGVVAATSEQRRFLAAQLTYTLTQLVDVNAVRITVSGVPFAIPGIGSISQVSDWESFDPEAAPLDTAIYALEGNHLSTVDYNRATRVPGYFGASTTLRDAAVALDGSFYAGAFPEGQVEVIRSAAPGADTAKELMRTTGTVATLSADRLNSVWVTATGPGGGVWTVHATTGAKRTTIADLRGRTVHALRVSRDGARAALVVEGTDRKRTLMLGRIVRSGLTARVEGLKRIESTLTNVVDVTWSGDATLIVIASRAEESQQPYTVGIDGNSISPNGVIPSSRNVAASPGRPVLVGTAANELWADRGNGWRRFVSAHTPIYPG